ncbi:PolC-type DNA polymerase III [Burkholderia contaminans]|nr:3'-5' exonuclease [Burkholderia contaminans]
MHEYIDGHWSQYDFAIVDVEGNGELPQEIVEVALAHVRRGKVEPRPDSWLVRPSRPVTGRAARFHGISNDMVAGAPSVATIATDLMAAFGPDVVVGHNVRVDIELLGRALPDWQPAIVIDTLQLARSVLPGAPSYSLGDLVMQRGLGNRGMPNHRASADALATAHLFLDLVQQMEAGGCATLRKLLDVAGVTTPGFDNNRQQGLF